MERSFADRALIGRLGRPRGTSARPPRSAYRGRAGAGRVRTAGWPAAALGGVGALTRAGLAAIIRRRHARVALVGALLATALLAGAWLWLRSSSFVSVQRVRVSGLHGPDAARIDAALQAAAQHMSTLHLDSGALRAAVAPFVVVQGIRATPEFPHRLRIQVLERLPVAALTVAGSRTAVAADGTALGPALLSGSLPSLSGSFEPLPGQRVRDPKLLAPLALLGAAPVPLERLVKNVFTGPRGLTVAMRNGLLAYFGDTTRPHAKWLALARVLADRSSAGAAYIDVRLPERPAAGFPAGTSPPAALPAEGANSTSEPTAPTESTVAALAAGLTSAHGGSSSSPGETSTATPGGGSSSTATPEAKSSSSAGESGSEAGESSGEASESAPTPGG
jgi:cell division protein FtsQ